MGDVQAAIDYLRGHLGPNDLLLVHPDARQGFQLGLGGLTHGLENDVLP